MIFKDKKIVYNIYNSYSVHLFVGKLRKNLLLLLFFFVPIFILNLILVVVYYNTTTNKIKFKISVLDEDKDTVQFNVKNKIKFILISVFSVSYS